MVLLGTAILGNNRFAILQDGATSSGAPAVPGQSAATMRIKLGDTVEGFKLSEVSEKRVVFARGASTVEVPLDYFRKTDIAQPRRPVAAQTHRCRRTGAGTANCYTRTGKCARAKSAQSDPRVAAARSGVKQRRLRRPLATAGGIMPGKCFTWFIVFSYVSSIALPFNAQIFREAQAAEPTTPPQAQPAPGAVPPAQPPVAPGPQGTVPAQPGGRSQPTRAHTATASRSCFRGNGFA